MRIAVRGIDPGKTRRPPAEAPMPRREKDRPEPTVRVSLEATRLGTRRPIEAYECLTPGRRRLPRTAAGPAALAEEAHAERGQGGKHA